MLAVMPPIVGARFCASRWIAVEVTANFFWFAATFRAATWPAFLAPTSLAATNVLVVWRFLQHLVCGKWV